ncbi:MAG TPA: OmpA family protein [Candidatus Saccharimonadales bacterium]|nr:OmpA family protein [Candidatus Saccharimonadales bacterium]
MKKILAFVFVLAALIVIPAVAQQTQNSTDDQQPASKQDQTQTQSSDQQATTGDRTLKYEQHEGFWGKMNPFARKKYVNKQLDPIRGRVNELDELTSKNSTMIADVDSRATSGIRQAMSKANDADAHAVEANNRATQAHQTAQQAHTRLTNVETAVSKIDQFQPVTQAEIHFTPGQSALSKNAKDALDEIATTLKDQKGYIIEVQGFSSGKGSAGIENSRRMAQMVVRYLVLNHNIPVYRIYTVGMGNAVIQADAKTTHTRGGRVELSLLKNGLGDLNSSSAAGEPNTATK